ncbi:hypothetical protein BD311DRAFT_809552 [Dichomitus squalens]|uniref:F-box domain-containing protein n=1 Tax=Dichomitus squalens TaxID=114155 RepID=A0A4Q9MCR5_9APHY|nr:hypothetical protein BD311DRAFT_809552 [Dichomitus squalens]
MDSDDDKGQLDWLHLLPEDGLSRFRYLWHPEQTFDPSVLEAPAVRAVTHLIVHGPQSAAILPACLSLPRLETLEVSLDDCDEAADWDVGAGLAPHLRRLVLRVYFCRCPVAIALFTAFAPQLVSFHLHALFHVLVPYHEWEQALMAHGTHLQHLILSGDTSWQNIGSPFLDGFVERAPSLEHIRCMQGTLTGAFFGRLPSSLKTFEYATNEGVSGAAEEMILSFLPGLRSRQYNGSVQTIRIIVPAGSPYREHRELEEACDEVGIRFEHVQDELYAPAQYLSVEAVIRSCFKSDFVRFDHSHISSHKSASRVLTNPPPPPPPPPLPPPLPPS